jgi:hypothetical protein
MSNSVTFGVCVCPLENVIYFIVIDYITVIKIPKLVWRIYFNFMLSLLNFKIIIVILCRMEKKTNYTGHLITNSFIYAPLREQLNRFNIWFYRCGPPHNLLAFLSHISIMCTRSLSLFLESISGH